MNNQSISSERRSLGLELNAVETDIGDTRRRLDDLRQQVPLPLLEIEQLVDERASLVANRRRLIISLRQIKLLQWGEQGVAQETWLR